MPESRDLCVLIAEIVGGDRIAARLGEAETARAMERCLNRVDLAVGGSGGEIIARDRSAVIATFDKADAGVLSACEMLERVQKLPPVSGTPIRVRIGIHYGPVINGRGDGVEGARQILLTCAAGQALVSSIAVGNLTPSARHFASADIHREMAQKNLPWPVFTVGERPGQASIAPALSVTPHIPSAPASPLTKSRIPSSTDAPEALLAPRLRVRHQKDVMFVEENRPVILIGRELGNDVVIIDPRASRQHARIERRREGFILVDQSTNGCFVSINANDERCIKTEEVTLEGAGSIGCGFSSKEFEDDVVYFDLV
jgi:class 3 adenylate cyclase